MKHIYTADWHIKLGQKNVPIDWQKARFGLFFDKLIELAIEENIPSIIIGGDLFDKVPSMAELALFGEFIYKLNMQATIKNVILYDGNHEAEKKTTTFLSDLKYLFYSASNGIITTVDTFGQYGKIDYIPYCRLKEFVSKGFPFQKAEILCTHVRGEIPPHVLPEIDLNLLDDWKVVLAGDLHSHSNCQRNILYPGSPMTTSFHRELVDTGVIVFEDSPFDWDFYKMELPQLIKKSITDPKEAIATDFHHTVYEIEGNMQELASVESGALIAEKIVRKESSTETRFTAEMTIEEEVSVYLKEILSIEEEKIPELLKVMHDITRTS